MECNNVVNGQKCVSQDGEYKQGISKKNGKPWRGWTCSICGNMQFINGPGPKPASSQTPGGVLPELKRQTELLSKILGELRAKNNNLTTEPEELNPDEDMPF